MTLRQHLTLLAALVGLSCAVQAWRWNHAVVPALDAVRYVAVAQSIEQEGIATALAQYHAAPLFPLCVWAVHQCAAAIPNGGLDWVASVRLAATFPLVLAILPLYVLVVRWKGARPAVAACVLFALLAETSRLGADGLGDGLHLLLFLLTFLGFVTLVAACLPPSADRARRWKLFSIAVATGLVWSAALLTRRESLLLAATLPAALGILAMQYRRRLALGRAVGTALVAAAVAAVVCLPVARLRERQAGATPADRQHTSGKHTNQHASKLAANACWVMNREASQAPKVPRPLRVPTKDTSVTSRFSGVSAALLELGREVANAWQHWLLLPVAAGIWCARRRWRPADTLALVYCVCHLIVVVPVAARLGYLSSRHLLLVVVLSLPCAGDAAATAGLYLRLAYRRSMLFPLAHFNRWRKASWWSGAVWIRRAPAQLIGWSVLIAAAAACLPQVLAPLHASRSSHRDAARFLAADVTHGAVLDTRGWTALYSGRRTYRLPSAGYAFCDPDLAFVVVEQAELERDSRRSRRWRGLLASAAEPVAMFGADEETRQRRVVVYRWNPSRFQAARRNASSRKAAGRASVGKTSPTAAAAVSRSAATKTPPAQVPLRTSHATPAKDDSPAWQPFFRQHRPVTSG